MRLVQTCGACPEQYEVIDKNDNLVGILHLRNGYFYAEYGNTVVYDADTKGDGIFDPDERDEHLANAVEAIQKEIKRERGEPTFESAYDRLNRLLDDKGF